MFSGFKRSKWQNFWTMIDLDSVIEDFNFRIWLKTALFWLSTVASWQSVAHMATHSFESVLYQFLQPLFCESTSVFVTAGQAEILIFYFKHLLATNTQRPFLWGPFFRDLRKDFIISSSTILKFSLLKVRRDYLWFNFKVGCDAKIIFEQKYYIPVGMKLLGIFEFTTKLHYSGCFRLL